MYVRFDTPTPATPARFLRLSRQVTVGVLLQSLMSPLHRDADLLRQRHVLHERARGLAQLAGRRDAAWTCRAWPPRCRNWRA
jgi:hypothetical protein